MVNWSKEVLERAGRVKLLLMDCDGVLTDGRLYYSERGEELKVFSVKDGLGLASWHQAGFSSGVITGRESKMLETRVDELGIQYLRQASKNKIQDFKDILADAKVTEDEVAYIGDDIPDIELLKIVGFPVAVADSAEELLSLPLYITPQNGGRGAVREVTNLLLKSRGLDCKE